jgi:hypothetical protein
MRNINASVLNAARLMEYLTIETKTWNKLLRYDLSIIRRDFRTASYAGATLTIAWALGWLFQFYTELTGDNLWGGITGPVVYTSCILLLCLTTPKGLAAKSYSRALSFFSMILLVLYAVLEIWL